MKQIIEQIIDNTTQSEEAIIDAIQLYLMRNHGRFLTFSECKELYDEYKKSIM